MELLASFFILRYLLSWVGTFPPLCPPTPPPFAPSGHPSEVGGQPDFLLLHLHFDSWALKSWCFWTVLEKTLDSSLDCKEIKPVNPKGNQPWIFIWRTDAEAEAPVLWPPDAKSWLIGKAPDAGKDWRQKEKGVAEDEMIGWHHRLKGHEFEQTLWDSLFN